MLACTKDALILRRFINNMGLTQMRIKESLGEKKDKKEHFAILCGDVTNAENMPVRVHSECLTGDGMCSLRCDF